MKLPKSVETDELIEKSGLEDLGFEPRWGGCYRIRLDKSDIKKHEDVLKILLNQAEKNFFN